jgi:regulation of enolase protein 1 (concanavalin A-like superfamily)
VWRSLKPNGKGGLISEPELTLARAAGPLPDMANGKWVTLAFQQSGRTAELWANGRRLAQFTVPAPAPGAGEARERAPFDGRPKVIGTGRYEIAYIAVWDLSAAPETQPVPAVTADISDLEKPLDPDNDCEFRSVGKSLSVKVPATLHDLSLYTAKHNSPRALMEVEGDFVLNVKVAGDFQPLRPSTNPRGIPYNGAGLLLWSDENNFFRLERGALLRNDTINTQVSFEERKGGNRGANSGSVIPAGTCYLRVERRGKQIMGAFSTDGSTWKELKSVDVTWPRKLQVGVAAINSSSAAFTVTFDEFSLKASGKSGPSSPPFAPFTDADVQRIAALPAAEQVEEVRKELMRRNPDFDGNMETRIEDGVVTEFRIVTDQVMDIAPIRVWSALRTLKCRGTLTNGKANGLLADLTPLEGMNLASLRHLSFESTKVTDRDLVHFRDCKDLETLNLSYTKVGDAGLAHFKDCKQLTELFVGATKVGDAGLANFQDCRKLITLALHGTNMTDAGLAYFKDCKDLKSLSLHVVPRVTDAGLVHLKDCKALTLLHLSGTNVSDAGLAHLKDCTSLADFDLSGTKVTDAGLATFTNCKNLTTLRLHNTQIGDVGLAHFKGIPLRSLWIHHTRVTDLTPLQAVPLEDICLTPKEITRGLDVLRDMKSLKTIGIEWRQSWPATEFWERYDKGELPK